jgi:NADPH:quinone reductase-like Zn-dependent oxidoreductase
MAQPINLDLLKDLKVEEVIDYSKTPFESVVHDVDVVLDMIGDDVQQRSYAVLKPGGMLVSTVQPPSEETAQAHGVRVGMVATAPPVGPTLTEVARMVEDGTIKPVVSTVLPLSEIRKAHEMIEGKHTRGKVALRWRLDVALAEPIVSLIPSPCDARPCRHSCGVRETGRCWFACPI